MTDPVVAALSDAARIALDQINNPGVRGPIERTLRQINSVEGTVVSVTDHRDHIHYPFRDLPYDEGGIIPAGEISYLTRPEPVLTEEQWRAYIARHPEPAGDE